ncbi:MAG TPA: hypothetical protein VF993_05555 [Myxococcales bacterium]
MNPLRFVEERGIVLAAARGPVPSLAQEIAGEPIRGSWWGHPRGQEIFRALGEVHDSPDVLMCKLVEGKRTFVHRRLWPALARLHPGPFPPLDRITEEHTPSGKHVTHSTPWPRWLPAAVQDEARRLSEDEARAALGPIELAPAKTRRKARPKAKRPSK